MTNPAPLEYGPSITLEQAKKIMAAAETEASSQNWPMVIAIVDSGGHPIMLHKMDHAQLGSIAIAQSKAETALIFKRPTHLFEQLLTGGTPAGLRLLSMPNMTALEGGFPIMHAGKIIGAIGISGMSAAQDSQVAQVGLNALE